MCGPGTKHASGALYSPSLWGDLERVHSLQEVQVWPDCSHPQPSTTAEQSWPSPSLGEQECFPPRAGAALRVARSQGRAAVTGCEGVTSTKEEQ